MANLFDPQNAQDREPDTVTPGDYIQWTRRDLAADYPPADYTATYVARISGGGSTEIQVTGTNYNGAFLFSVSSEDSADFVAGAYHWQLEMVRDSDSARIVVDTGEFVARPDLDINGTDPRTHAEVMVSKIESLLEGKADADVSEYSIGNRSLTKMSVPDLLRWRDYYRTEMRRELMKRRQKQGRRAGNQIHVRFDRGL
jgi:hypothetical protein